MRWDTSGGGSVPERCSTPAYVFCAVVVPHRTRGDTPLILVDIHFATEA
jgi:hypothetical protein